MGGKFEAKLSDARIFSQIVDAISALIDEGNYYFSPDGLSFRAMDPSHVAMVDLELNKAFFEDYVCEEDFVLGVNFDELSKITSRAGAGDALTLETSEEEGGRLRIKLMGKATRIFTLPILSLESEELPRLEIDFNVKTSLDSDLLKQALKDAGIAGEYVEIIAEDNTLKIESRGERQSVQISLEKDGEGVHEYNVSESSKSMYAIDMLSKMIKAASLSDVVTVEFSSDMPMKFSFGLPGQGKLTYFLAPRIEK
ncbi:MAG: proliferating cell nuclear antigen (pcna) [Candidatus Wukongarchaeota archaeon]|nr:proliferating cell nuclear antigen (pcna) [Candidatus Wukongarchaeota archaeon]MDO8128769.1 proliferating cell nuclear antigen (pcna) [Candidatus Wukongarchaeota archaeon]